MDNGNARLMALGALSTPLKEGEGEKHRTWKMYENIPTMNYDWKFLAYVLFSCSYGKRCLCED
jgi:hypothetical protein